MVWWILWYLASIIAWMRNDSIKAPADEHCLASCQAQSTYVCTLQMIYRMHIMSSICTMFNKSRAQCQYWIRSNVILPNSTNKSYKVVHKIHWYRMGWHGKTFQFIKSTLYEYIIHIPPQPYRYTVIIQYNRIEALHCIFNWIQIWMRQTNLVRCQKLTMPSM